MHEGVYYRFSHGFRLHERHVLALDHAVALVGLHHVEHVDVVEHPVERDKQAGVAELTDRVERGCLGRSREDGHARRHAAVVGEQLREEVEFAIWREQPQVLGEGFGTKFDSTTRIVREEPGEG